MKINIEQDLSCADIEVIIKNGKEKDKVYRIVETQMKFRDVFQKLFKHKYISKSDPQNP